LGFIFGAMASNGEFRLPTAARSRQSIHKFVVDIYRQSRENVTTVPERSLRATCSGEQRGTRRLAHQHAFFLTHGKPSRRHPPSTPKSASSSPRDKCPAMELAICFNLQDRVGVAFDGDHPDRMIDFLL
jgi:hypothetical protein